MNPAGAVPDKIRTEVLYPAGEAAVHLGAQRVYVKSIQRLLVVERVEVNAHKIVGADIVTPGYRGLDFVRLSVKTLESKIKVFAVIGHIGYRVLRNIMTEVRNKRLEPCDRRSFGPDRFIEFSIEDRRSHDLERLEDLRSGSGLSRAGEKRKAGPKKAKEKAFLSEHV
jgi:hypothetical protein